MPTAMCVCACAELAPLETTTRVMILMPQREARRSSNTSRFVQLRLPSTRLLVRGRRDGPFPREALVQEDRRSLVLYPRAGAPALDAAVLAQDPRPVTLIVPDGCWREGRRIDVREHNLDGLERVTLAPGPPSRYRLRHQTDARRLSTLEAVARALEVLEGERGPVVRAGLEATLELFVLRTLLHRGAHDKLDDDERAALFGDGEEPDEVGPEDAREVTS